LLFNELFKTELYRVVSVVFRINHEHWLNKYDGGSVIDVCACAGTFDSVRFLNLGQFVGSGHIYAKFNWSIIISCVIELEVHLKEFFALLRLFCRLLALSSAIRTLELIIVIFKISICLLSILPSAELFFLKDQVGMIALYRMLGVNIEVINAHRLGVFCQLDIVEVCRLLVDVMDHYQVVSDLHLVQGSTSLYLDTLTVFESVLWVKLMYENFACLGTQVQHYGLVIQSSNKYLMLILPFIIQTSREKALVLVAVVSNATHLEVVFASIRTIKHLQIFVEYSWGYRNISKCLGRSLPKTKRLLSKAHLDRSGSLRAPTSHRGLRVHCTLSLGTLNTVAVFSTCLVLLIGDICI